MNERVAVVGGGIVGLANAWREAAHGAQVTLFERSVRAEGASVRNFGMVWPLGQPEATREAALLSRELWDEVARETGVWTNPLGSLHLACREDEVRVLEEFAQRGLDLGYGCRMMSTSECRDACPGAGETVRCGLFSPTELGVDPRQVIATLPGWLSERYGVALEFGATVCEVGLPNLHTTDGRGWEFDRVVVASGADFATLYPEVLAAAGLRRCKLQMMRTAPQPGGWRLGPMVASGLTLRHYANFAICPGLDALKRRVAEETPELDHYGIHVMAAQNGLGEVVLGDSHEYGDAVLPFDSEEITALMLRELQKLIKLPDWRFASRWHGIYPVQPSGGVQFVHEPEEGVTIVIATGGCGMTMSFGLAELRVRERAAAAAVGASV